MALTPDQPRTIDAEKLKNFHQQLMLGLEPTQAGRYCRALDICLRKGAHNQYREEVCVPLMLRCCAAGYTLSMIAAEFGVSAFTLRNWRKQYPAFQEAYLQGKDMRRAHLDTAALSNLENPKFNDRLLDGLYAREFRDQAGDAKVKIKGLSEATNEKERVLLVLDAISKGYLTAKQAKELLGSLKEAAELESIPELRQQLDDIKAKV